MSYQKTVLRTWSENILFSALVELTYRCNLDCVFCYNDLDLRGRPMSVDDYRTFFEDLASLSCLHLTLSGGEPLVHPRFFEIAASARELGFVVRIKSNGHALRGRLLERLNEEIDPFVVEVSLHGAIAATHDRQTRLPGSFDRLLANLEEMVARGVRFKINSTLTRWNEAEIEGMFTIAERFGAPLTFDPDVTPRDNGDFSPLEISATEEGRRRLFSYGSAVDVTRQGDSEIAAVDSRKHCGAGSSGIAVDPFGNVYPCVQWRRRVGNLHDRSIREIWSGNGELETVRRLSEEVKRALPRGPGMFCPGTAEGLTGSPLPIHPSSAAR